MTRSETFSRSALIVLMSTFLVGASWPLFAGPASPSEGIITYASETADTLSIYEIQADGTARRQRVAASVPRRGDYHPHISPDGQWLSFTTYRYGGWKLAISRRDGSEVRRLTPTPHYVYDADFSPDGKWLVYRRVETPNAPWFRGNLEIFAIGVDGSGERNLTRSTSDDENPSFSSDGRYIVYQSYVPKTENYEIFIMDADGKNQRNLTQSPEHDIAPSFSPDGTRIAFQRELEGRLELFIMDADGSNTRLLKGAAKVAAIDDGDNVQVWKFNTDFSPSGRQIVFTGMVDGDLELFAIGSDGSGLRRLTHHPGDDLHAVWTKQ